MAKGLERDTLRLVIADKNTKPFSMTSHIPILAESRKIIAIALDDLMVTIGPLIGIQSLVAIGIKVFRWGFYLICFCKFAIWLYVSERISIIRRFFLKG